MKYIETEYWPEPGTVISVPFFLIYRHKGLVSDKWYGDKPMVISNSALRGGVVEETWDEFRGNKQVQIEGYPSNSSPYEVLQRAREFVGTRYDLFQWNCDDLVNVVHQVNPQKTQLKATLVFTILGSLILASRS